MTSRRPALIWGIALLGVLAAALLASLLLGSVPLAPGAVLRALLGDGDAQTVSIVRDLRLPRAFLAVLVGGALALSGAALQALLGNPLADPYLLGVSGGAEKRGEGQRERAEDRGVCSRRGSEAEQRAHERSARGAAGDTEEIRIGERVSE